MLGTARALSDAFSQPHIDMNALAIASLVLLMGSIGWRRVNSAFTTMVAISALITFTYASGYNGDGSFEAVAIALNFYLLGRMPGLTAGPTGGSLCWGTGWPALSW